MQAKEERPLAPSHIRLVLQTLSTILNAAVADDRMTRNPCKVKGVVRPPKPDERRVVPWEAARISAIRAALPYRYQAVADVGKGAGLRQGEVFGLSPDDIDWLRKIIHVRRQVKIAGGRRVFAPPKFGKDLDVPLSAALTLRLSAHLKVFPAAEVTLPWQKPGGKAGHGEPDVNRCSALAHVEQIRLCGHPDPLAPDRSAARAVASHPEQGWSLLCNGVVLFDDGGELLPVSSSVTVTLAAA